jgi:arylsulfatase A-like enzyme
MGSLIVVLLLGAIAALSAFAAPPKEAQPPNVLLITVDTLRADHLSSYGYYRQTSPYIDKLAAEGVRFENAYTAIPLTGPSHLALFTGRYPHSLGVRRNGVAIPDEAKVVSLPQILKKHGYRTGAFVSAWPLTARLTHLDRWFNHFDEDLPRRYQLFNSSRYAEDVTPRALKWLRERAAKKTKPFFLWVHYFDPHSPYDFRESFQPPLRAGAKPARSSSGDEEMDERIRAYDSEIYYMDHYIGQLLGALDTLRVKDSTLVVLAADHGESLGEHDYVGHGRHLFENIVEIPLLFRLPGKVTAGKVIRTPVSTIDLAPSILDLTLGNTLQYKKSPKVFSGKSLAASLTGPGEPEERRIYYVTFDGKKGFMPNWFSSLWVSDRELPLSLGYTVGRMKTVWLPAENKLRIHNVAQDPLETKGRILDPGRPGFRTETVSLKRWFSATDGQTVDEKLSAHDLEVLKSLGYAQ